MIEVDLEDYLEEVKFQMTEYEELEETTILEWEAEFRNWILSHQDKKKCIIKNKNDITIILNDEDEMEEVAAKFYKAYKNNKTIQYWKKLKWGR